MTKLSRSITVTPENAQYTLDGAYGSIDGKTIVFPAGDYSQLELGRATKYAGSNTDYYIGGVAPGNKKTFEEFVTIKTSGEWSGSAYYVRNMSNVTLKAAEGATVNIAGLVASSGHVYGNVYDYVLNKHYESGSAYYLSQNLKNITIEGIHFTAKVEFSTSSANTEIDGVTFENCTFNINNTASNNQALRYYNESDNGQVKNLTVTGCKFNSCYQGVYTQKINGVTVTNSSFDTTGHNAIAVQSGSNAVNHKAVVITDNTFTNIGDRVIRFGDVGADTQITIQNNTATNSGDKAGQVMKAQSLAKGITYNICGNNWGEGRTVANSELGDAEAVAEVNGTKYTSLNAAITAAKSGDRITILKDINESVGLYLGTRENITLTAVPGVKVDGDLTIGYHSNHDKDKPQKENSTLTVKNITVNGFLRVDSADQKVVVSGNTAKDIKVYTWKIDNMDIQILNNTVVGGGGKYGIYVVPETTNYDLKVDRNTISGVSSHALAIQGNGQGSAVTAAKSISVTNNNFTCAKEKAAFKIWADTKFAPKSISSYDGLTPDMKALARKIVAEGNNTFSTADGRVMFNVYDFSFNGWTITLPSGAGYTVTPTNDSVSPVLANESYSFTLTVNSGYQKGTNFAVKANGVDLQETDGKYVLSGLTADTEVTVSGITPIPSAPSDSGSSGGGGGSSTSTPSQPTTSTETKPDGSTTTTESKPDGTVTESNTSKPTTDASGNTSQTTTETSTGKDGVTESKTETVTKPDGSASSTTESTTTKPDGTKTESTTETTVNKDGSTASTTTSTTTGKDGTVTESKTEATTSTVTNADGSTTETKQETTTTSTGSKTESTTVTTVNKDGSTTATTTATTTDKTGTVTESKTESTTSKNGTTTEVTVTTETKANGTVIESKTATTTQTNGSSSSTTTATTTKADGTTTTSKTTATTSLSTNKSTGTVTETKKETTTTSDGVKSEGTTVTQIRKDGTVTSTETVKASDSTGTTATKTTTLDAKGDVTTKAEATVSAKAATEAAKTGEAVTIPVDVTATKSTVTAPVVNVKLPATAESVKVELPVQNVTPGTVAVIVKADGTEKIVSASVVTENGVALTLDGSATVKLVDNAKSFVDVPETNVFYNEISSLSARNIMIGVSSEKFDLHNSVTLDQVANVAGRITGAVDVKDFNAGVAWGKDGGLKTGNVSATRGDVLKALYIAAGSPAVEDTSILTRFKDASSIPADLAVIAAWAAQNGILKGNMDGTAGLSNNVTRGQACALAGRTMGTLA